MRTTPDIDLWTLLFHDHWNWVALLLVVLMGVIAAAITGWVGKG